MANYSVYDVADWFLTKESMSPKKLQKLVYYAYAWTLVFHNDSDEKLENKLFDDKIEAWVHGPVVRKLYRKYAPYGYHNIEKKNDISIKFSNDIEGTLEEVWSAYGDFDGNQLEALTHNEDPWKEARVGLKPLDGTDRKIKDQIMFNYYSEEMVE